MGIEWVTYKGNNTKEFKKTFVDMEGERKNGLYNSCLKHQEIGKPMGK
jgi:hypothetical protein